MKQMRSMDEAIHAARQMRSELPKEPSPPERSEELSRLKVAVAPESATGLPEKYREPLPQMRLSRPSWVRHTIGLREATSLKLRDAAESQKRKARYGTLRPDEPANEQEIADLGINLALEKLGLA